MPMEPGHATFTLRQGVLQGGFDSSEYAESGPIKADRVLIAAVE
jgi:hypothetical protein